MSKLFAVKFTAFLSVFLVAINSRASVLVSSGPSVEVSGYTLAGTPPNTMAGGQFTLNHSALVTDGLAFLQINTGTAAISDLSAAIYGDNGANAPSSTLFLSSTADSGTLSSANLSTVDFTFPTTTLSAGTYWFELTDASTSGGTINWVAGRPLVNDGVDGNVNPYVTYTGAPAGTGLAFNIDGAVPEPTSLGMLSLAAVGLLTRRRSARRASMC